VKLRQALLVAHRYAGVVATPVVLAVGLSGALLAVAPDLLERSGPHGAGGVALAESTLVARVRAGAPGDPVAGIEFGNAGDAPQVFTMRSGVRWFVDPASGRLLARRSGETALEATIATARQLHVRLAAGNAGEWLVDLSTIVVALLAATGVVLWWRKRAWRMRNDAAGWRFHWELHQVVGAWVSLLVLALALTGIWLAFEGTLGPAIGLEPRRDPALPHSIPPGEGVARRDDPDAWLAAARAALPGEKPMQLQWPEGERSAVRVLLRPARGLGRSAVFVDRWSARVLRTDAFAGAAGAFRAHVLVRGLHTGDAGGAWLRTLVALGALAMSTLAVTGVWVWRARPRG